MLWEVGTAGRAVVLARLVTLIDKYSQPTTVTFFLDSRHVQSVARLGSFSPDFDLTQ